MGPFVLRHMVGGSPFRKFGFFGLLLTSSQCHYEVIATKFDGFAVDMNYSSTGSSIKSGKRYFLE